MKKEIRFGATAAIMFCLMLSGTVFGESRTGLRLHYPPGVIVISDDNYNVFFRGHEDEPTTSLSRADVGADQIKELMSAFPDADMIAFPVGETWETGMAIGFANVFPDYLVLAEKPFRELIDGNDPLFLGEILRNMGVTSLDDVEIYENDETAFLYQEGQNSDGSAFCEYVTMFDTALWEIYAETHLADNDPIRNMDTIRELAKTMADSLHREEYLEQIAQKEKSETEQD